MLFAFLWFSSLAAAQSVITITGTLTGADALPTGSEVSYASAFSTITASSSSRTGVISGISSSFGEANSTGSVSPSSTNSVTLLVGGGSTTLSNNMTASSTTTSAKPTNTQPCNGYPEFCTRKYSNITEVCAHNSPFSVKKNAASNQALDVTTQLNDGIRMLQGQAHYVNGTLYFCHTSCDLLNAGTVQAYLEKVADWVHDNPYDVVTILIGNADYAMTNSEGVKNITAETYVEPIQNSGLTPYIYYPPKIPMRLEDWPTLGEMIVTQKRVVIFMDYNANQTAVPYILDEFSQMWETPYSPTNISFPCDVQRPPNLSRNSSLDWLYIANHNLNTEVAIGSFSLLIPNVVDLNVTNGLNGTGSLGLMSNECTADWGRPPNFLLVDYYNIGSFNGSVFAVAAEANNVTYNGKCCGTSSFATQSFGGPPIITLSVAFLAAITWMI
ncbi:PLC-like phosphodiesterase [Glonium stellatum]|uniref:PLC-like phosphodiesterase n=1 Tax=Glonium stellatum TaxID=574774 RepID=A0A8E2FBS6_9PEZI|nr:PLC-like phosphodiesterase [Glonium stellatum]